MSKTATIFAPAPTKGVTLCILPYGLYANKEAQTCEIGSKIRFQDAWKITDFTLVRRTKIAVKSSVFNFLLKALFDDTMTYERWIERWQGVAVSEGWGKSAFDTDSVLLIELQKLY